MVDDCNTKFDQIWELIIVLRVSGVTAYKSTINVQKLKLAEDCFCRRVSILYWQLSTCRHQRKIDHSRPSGLPPYIVIFLSSAGPPLPQVTLSKKWSQGKSYEVRGQSDMCHTSVIFMPAFPWHQMGGKFSRKLVSTLSYLLYTCLCQEILKWFIFFLKFPICSPRMLCEQLQAICLIPLKLWHHVIMLNFEFPNTEIHCSSLPLHR